MWHGNRIVALLGLLLAGCPAHQSNRAGGSGLDDDELGTRDEDAEKGVSIGYAELPDAIVEPSESGIPRHDASKLRRVLCEGREAEEVIFYRLVVSTHWHYFWLCSDRRARRVSSRHGARQIHKWLEDLKSEAALKSRACQPGAGRPVLQGTHESGVRTKAYCDGRITLRFPDGVTAVQRYETRAPSGGGSTAASCPPCPLCPACSTANGASNPPPVTCPAAQECPPARACPACPPPPVCPACSCAEQVKQAGVKGFWQGVNKACQRICKMTYDKCRAIDPKTALCHMVGEYCTEQCAKP